MFVQVLWVGGQGMVGADQCMFGVGRDGIGSYLLFFSSPRFSPPFLISQILCFSISCLHIMHIYIIHAYTSDCPLF